MESQLELSDVDASRVTARFGSWARRAFEEAARRLGRPVSRLAVEEIADLVFVRAERVEVESTEWDTSTSTRLVGSLGWFDGRVGRLDSWLRLSGLIALQAPPRPSIDVLARWIERSGMGVCPRSEAAMKNFVGVGPVSDVMVFSGTYRTVDRAPREALALWQQPTDSEDDVELLCSGSDKELYRVRYRHGALSAVPVCRGGCLDVVDHAYRRNDPETDPAYERFLRS